MQQWEQLTERLGFWIHLDEAYVTYHQSYVESVWWSLKNLFDRGLLYQGHKIVWWWAQGGTALSSRRSRPRLPRSGRPERVRAVSAGRRAADTSLLVWTTTPWTLPSNQFAAVHPDLEYATVRRRRDGREADPGRGAGRDDRRQGQARAARSKRRCRGERAGRAYAIVPPFDYYYAHAGRDSRDGCATAAAQHIAWRVVAADFVTDRHRHGRRPSGPGLRRSRLRRAAGRAGAVRRRRRAAADLLRRARRQVHRRSARLPGPLGQGRRQRHHPRAAGRGLLFHQEQYLHDYPFCWRAEEDPLIQYPRKSWFIRTTQFKDQMLANNRQINWLPEHIRDGRFGNFLEPTSIGPCRASGTGARRCRSGSARRPARWRPSASYDELLAKPGVQGTEVWDEAKQAKPELPDDLKVHKPYIDAVTYDSPFAPGGRMRRVPEVIDCWYDSGAMPFAQWGYPHQPAREQFRRAVPRRLHQRGPRPDPRLVLQPAGDQHAVVWRRGRRRTAGAACPHPLRPASPAPMLPIPHPFRNCIVLGPDAAAKTAAEDVEEQAELPRAATRSSTATGPTPCGGTSSPTSRRGPRSATASRRSRTASPSSCCGCGTSTASS